VRQLVDVLEQHTKYAANPDEKIQLVRRAAELVQNKLNDLPGAAARWKRARASTPTTRRRSIR